MSADNIFPLLSLVLIFLFQTRKPVSSVLMLESHVELYQLAINAVSIADFEVTLGR